MYVQEKAQVGRQDYLQQRLMNWSDLSALPGKLDGWRTLKLHVTSPIGILANEPYGMRFGREVMHVVFHERTHLYQRETSDYANLGLRPTDIGHQRTGRRFFGVTRPG